MTAEIFKKIDNRTALSKEDALSLLNTENTSEDFYKIISKANSLSREVFQNKGYIFAQIGLNSAPCSGNCKFCSLGKDNYTIDKSLEKTAQEVLNEAALIDMKKISALFLMTTADYDNEKLLEIGKLVKETLPPDVDMVANVGDFSDSYAEQLKAVGFTGVYHIVRMREGIDTAIPKQQRIDTLDAIKKAKLQLYYCVEPIGREHSYDEIADEMLRARDYGVDVMAVMRRVTVPGSAVFEKSSELDDIEFIKIAAVARLVTMPKRSMNIHEPLQMAMAAGVNQLYAEIGVNPRDVKHDTQNSRGFSVDEVEAMLKNGGYSITRSLV